MAERYPYRQLGTNWDSTFRNDLNANFDDIETDIKNVDDRIDQIQLTAGTGLSDVFPSQYIVNFDSITVGDFILTRHLTQLGIVTLS